MEDGHRGIEEPRRLLRSHQDRMLAGVAGGLADYFRIDPIITRIGFGVSVLFGGLGIVLYLAMALFVPADDGTENPQAPAQRSTVVTVLAGGLLLLIALPLIGGGLLWGDWPGPLFWIGIPLAAALLAWAALRDRSPADGDAGNPAGRSLAATLLVGALAFSAFVALLAGAALLTAVGEGVAVAVGIAGAGLLLVTLALTGVGARWLILPVAAIGLGAAAAAASDVDLGGGIGERSRVPATVAAIPAEGYELGIGRLAIDLRELEWRGRSVELDVDQGIGELVVAVPERVCVRADAHVGAGEARIAGDREEGFDLDLASAEAGGAAPQLRLRADLDLGAIRVVNDDAVDLDRLHADGGDRDDDERARSRNEAACGS